LAILGIIAALWAGYLLTGRTIQLVINGQAHQVRTHTRTVEAALKEMGISLGPEDIVSPPPETPLSSHETITVQLARPVTVEADGQSRQLLTHRQKLSDLLADLGLVLNPRDEVLLDGVKVPFDVSLPPARPSPQAGLSWLLAVTTPRGAVAAGRPPMVRLVIHRSIPVTLHEGQAGSTFYTSQPNVGEALLEQGVTLFLGDEVTPSLGARLSPGMHIYIKRSLPVTLEVDGQVIKTRTHEKTVGQVLAEAGIILMGQDFSRPPIAQPIAGDEAIEVVRVRETVELGEEFIPFETTWIPDEALEIDQQQIRQSGGPGVIKSRQRVRYENGQEVGRVIEDEWLDREPNKRIIAYGTKIVVRTLNTSAGPIQYWRKIPMLATSYSAATSGKAPDHPAYGITRSGMLAGYGIVAVDPKVVPLRTQLYIPNYGLAVAGDTGGAILGKHIDLGFDEGQPLPNIYGWRDIYVLTPVPPANRVRYVLPQWPQR
jgi:uncharacterized protein YabE (DUF348 family)